MGIKSLSGDPERVSFLMYKKTIKVKSTIRENMSLKTLFFATPKIFPGYFARHFNCNKKDLYTSINKNDNITEKFLN